MSDTQSVEDRLDRLVAALERSGVLDVAVEPRAAVNPDGSPGHVAAGELIESAWGNAVSDTFRNWCWQVSINADVAKFAAMAVQTRAIVVTTNGLGEASVPYQYPYTVQPSIIAMNAEPALLHQPILKTPGLLGSIFVVRSLYDGSIVASAATSIAYIVIGQY